MTQVENMPFLTVQNVWKYYPVQSGLWPWKKKQVPILSNISFTLEKGSVLGLLGESGSGKSTLSRLVLGLENPDSGHIFIEGQPVSKWRKAHRGKVSAVFQDYTTSVNPGLAVGAILAEGFHAIPGHHASHAELIGLMARVELEPDLLTRLPHQLSGGQLQRVCIARALASSPDFIVFDEAVSALDVSVQTEIVKLLAKLKGNTSYLFITHDIQVAAMLCDRILILHHGSITDDFKADSMGRNASPHLQKLLASTVLFRSSFEEEQPRS